MLQSAGLTCRSVRADRKNITPLGAHQTDDFPEGLSYIKMLFFALKTGKKASCTVLQEVRVRKQDTIWTYFDDLDTLDALYKKV